MQKQSFSATIKERYCLNPGSEKATYHVVLDLEESGIQYAVGDCLGIYPENDPSLVQKLISQWDATGEEIVEDRKGNLFALSTFLTQYANLSRLPETNQCHSLADFCKGLSPLLPRFYSIASSMSVVGQEAHLTVGLIDGLCTHFLCNRVPLGIPRLAVFHHPARNFSLHPESFDKPVIMVGPGTGIAPFRGFMQERVSGEASPKNWLFFGERHRETDFYYKNYWEELVSQGKLTLDCAFSRDQADKVYVQHKMLEKSGKLWEWLQEGAYLFVCGDASRMAKDVEKILQAIVEREGGYSPENAKAYLKDLKKSNRYQRDVY